MKIFKVIKAIFVRLLQIIAFFAPGASSIRVICHKLRGVNMGKNIFIGTACLLETEHPEYIKLGNNVALSARVTIFAHFKSDFISIPSVIIEDDVYIGANVVILPNVTIGKGAVVTAGSVVSSNVKPKHMVRGNPAKTVAICEVPLAYNGSYLNFIQNAKPVKKRKKK